MAMLKNDWAPLLEEEFNKDYFRQLWTFLENAYEKEIIYPKKDDTFNALNYTSYADTKAVILGQDPYHGHNQAHGLSFSVQYGEKIPPSLRNIYQELAADIGISAPNHGNLTNWAKAGVLLLNTVLTVKQGEANAHKGKGWEYFTDEVIRLVDKKLEPVVFILWGRQAQAKERLIKNPQHLIIKSPHPSPFSAHRGFFGSRPFSRTNAYLERYGRGQIDWELG